MNELKSTPFLILDCQTTGMRPSVGSLLEFCWAENATAACPSVSVRGGLVQLPPGADIPQRVREITGISFTTLAEGARSVDEHRDEFSLALISASRFGAKPIALVHYAQFEDAWLRDLLQAPELPFEMFCTHRIASKLFPKVPSRNIRGLTGFFGYRIGEIKRAAQHVQATHLIWQGLVPALEAAGVRTVDELRAFMSEKKKKPSGKTADASAQASGVKSSYDYRVDRAKRLALPAKPGIYKMIAKSGEILYVGKATSLKDRVNSYFRGKKGRDPRKLELMAQVWDLEIVECASAIEAALTESDEIKRLNPPYNVSLKAGNRALLFYNRELTEESPEPTSEFCVGPFRRFNSVEHLRTFVSGLEDDFIFNVFYEPIDNLLLEDGYALFEEKHGSLDGKPLRDHVAFGVKLLRANEGEADQDQIDADQGSPLEDSASLDETDVPLTAQDILEKIERLYMRAASTYLRSKEITRLLWSDVRWVEKGETKSLMVRGGKLAGHPALRLNAGVQPWQGLAISDYDRMSVLLMEISKVDHEIEAVR